MNYKKGAVNTLETTRISKHSKDIIQKYASGLFKDTTLEFFGIKTAKIKELINVELPVVEVAENSIDFIFLLEDETYLHFEFQTTYNKSDLIRFAGYDLRLFERDGHQINTVVIYTADVKEVPDGFSIGSLSYNPAKVMMYDYNGNAIYEELEAKIRQGQDLTDADILNLIFLPLMRNTIPKDELAVKSIELARSIADTTKQNACIAAAFAFANRYLDDNGLNKLLEVLRMTDLVTLLVEDAVSDKAIEIAKNLLAEDVHIKIIAKTTGLDLSTIQRLKSELSSN